MSNTVFSNPRRAARLAFEAVNTHATPTLRTLTEDITAATGKMIEIRELAELGRLGTAAHWFELPDRHLILESAPTSEHHQEWVRMHEFGHIIFAHLGWAESVSKGGGTRGSGLSLADAARLHRASFRLPSEQSAEEFARYADRAIREGRGGTLDNDFTVVLS